MPTGKEILTDILNGKRPVFEAKSPTQTIAIYMDGRVEGMGANVQIINLIKPVMVTLQAQAAQENQKSISANFPTATVIEDLSGRSHSCAE